LKAGYFAEGSGKQDHLRITTLVGQSAVEFIGAKNSREHDRAVWQERDKTEIWTVFG
jgi:hypothetical protein